MVVNSANARIFGSDDDAIWIAPLGTPIPAALAEPDEPWEDVGWLHSDGITNGTEASVQKFRGHQGARVVRTKITESGTTFQFQCLETTALTLGLQLDIKSKATVAGVTTMKVSAGAKVLTRAFLIDTYDEDETTIHYRRAIARGEIGERAEVKFANGEITGYVFTVEVIGDYDLITNDEAVAAP